MKHKNEPLGDTRGGDGTEARATTLPLPLYDTTNGADSQPLGIGRALRLRDALITLERRLIEARTAFEDDIIEILKDGGM